METLLQLIVPALLFWLVWKTFRSPKPNGDLSGSGGNSSSGGCEGHGGSNCDGGSDGGGGGD